MSQKVCEALCSDLTIDKLIQARSSRSEKAIERGGRLLCDLAAAGCLSPTLFSEKDICSELVAHAELNEKCMEEAVWAIALLAGKEDIARSLVERQDVIKLLLAATEESDAICLQVLHCTSPQSIPVTPLPHLTSPLHRTPPHPTSIQPTSPCPVIPNSPQLTQLPLIPASPHPTTILSLLDSPGAWIRPCGHLPTFLRTSVERRLCSALK